MFLKKINKKILLQVVTAGLCYGLAFPPINFHFLIFFSFVIIINLTVNCVKFKEVFLRTYFVFFMAGLIAISWISLSGLRENADSFLIFSGVFVLFIYPLFFVPPVILFYYTYKNFTSGLFRHVSLFFFPFLWTGFEYVSTLGQINFPWLFAGNSQTYNLSKIQFAEYTGMFGVSFWICIISCLMFFLFLRIIDKIWKPASARSISVIAIIICVYMLPDIQANFGRKNYQPDDEVKLGIIQPNVNPWIKWSGKQNDLINDYLGQIRQLYSQNPDVKMIILPETALPYYFRERHFEERLQSIKSLCDSMKVALLIGTPDLEIYEDQSKAPPDAKIMRSSGLKYDTYNTAVLFESQKDKNEFQKHHKVKLVVGSERMPYQELMPFVKDLIGWGVGIGNWQIGYDTNVFVLDNKYKFNTAICYESVYPEFFSEFVKRGAEFCVIITNDGWWGKFFGTYQHNRFAVFRAIENRRWIARCANTGISDFIDPEGNFHNETEIDVKTNIVNKVGIIKGKTFYTMHGDLFSKVCLVIGLVLFGVSFFPRRSKSS